MVQVVGRARAGDPVTTAAIALSRAMAEAGHAGHLVSAGRTGDRGFEHIEDCALPEGDVVVHTVDGGSDLLAVLPALVGRTVRLLHHGSDVGSDRSALRGLRGSTVAAAATDPAGREELRRLGFGHVAAAPIDAFDGALADVVADEATSANVLRHPGPRIVVAGPVGPGQSIELVIDAFAGVLTHHQPSATLSICGPSADWYSSMLRRRILQGGLLACELVQPTADSQLVARLDSATAVVALHPRGLAAYLHRAARAGARIVAPLDAATMRLPADRLRRIPARTSRLELADAMASATADPPAPGAAAPMPRPAADGLLRALGIE